MTVKQRALTYELLYAAVHGDAEAEEIILAIYDPYIRKLSRIIIRTSDGEIYRVLDEDLYIILKFKLHTIIKDFKIS